MRASHRARRASSEAANPPSENPTPWATKVRYFAIGAAAAGLFIFAAHWLRSYLGPHAEPAMGPHAVEVAKSDPAPGKLVRRDSSPGIAPVVPATPDRLATLVTDGYTDAVRTLHARVQDLDALRVTPEGLERVREQADRARRYAGMLRWMVDGEYMMLPQDDVANLTAVEAVGDQVRDFRDADNLRRVLRPIRSLRVEQPRSFFCNPCVKDEPGFMQEFLTRLHSSRLEDAFGSQIQVVVQASGAGSQVLVFMPVR